MPQTVPEDKLPSIWRYVLEETYVCHDFNFLDVNFESRWLTIDNGTIVIPKDYAWDGCSPSFKLPSKIFPNGYWFGTPEGPLGTDGKPVTYIASLVHDALCQYRPELHNVTKEMSVNIFRDKLIEKNAPKYVISVYPKVVSLLGPQKWLGKK